MHGAFAAFLRSPSCSSKPVAGSYLCIHYTSSAHRHARAAVVRVSTPLNIRSTRPFANASASTFRAHLNAYITILRDFRGASWRKNRCSCARFLLALWAYVAATAIKVRGDRYERHSAALRVTSAPARSTCHIMALSASISDGRTFLRLRGYATILPLLRAWRNRWRCVSSHSTAGAARVRRFATLLAGRWQATAVDSSL